AAGNETFSSIRSFITRALPCKCELVGLRVPPFWRLFGLSVLGRTRSCSPTVSEVPRGERSPSGRFFLRCAAEEESNFIEPSESAFLNIQGGDKVTSE